MGKIIFTYWKNLLIKAARTMWKELGIWGILFGFVFSGVYVLYTREQTFSIDGILAFAKIFITFIVIAWVIFILIVIAIQDKKKQHRIDELAHKLEDVENSNNQSITLNSVSIIQDYRQRITNVYYISQDQNSIDGRPSEELALSVERVPTNILRNQGKDVKAVALLVKSHERRKIIELKARIDFLHSYYEPEFDTVFRREYDLNSFLFWDDDKTFKKEIELRPSIQKILVLCEFLKYKTSDGEIVNMATMTSDPYPEAIDFSKESVFQIRIMLQGKLEGEYEYRTLHYKDLFYTKPEEQRILFLNDAEKAYSDIPKELLEISKAELRYWERRDEQGRINE